VVGGQIFPSSIDFHRRHYNTLALPCERVIESKFLVLWYMVFGVGDSKNVIVFDPLITGHVIRRMRSGRVRIFNGNQRETL